MRPTERGRTLTRAADFFWARKKPGEGKKLDFWIVLDAPKPNGNQQRGAAGGCEEEGVPLHGRVPEQRDAAPVDVCDPGVGPHPAAVL